MSKAPKSKTTSHLTNQISRVESMVADLETAMANPELSPAKRQAAERAMAGAQHLLAQRKARQQATKPS
jgi:hypothetical protein